MSEKKAKKVKNERVRQFATIIYEESAPEDWREKVDNLCIPAFASPLHDKDVYEKDDPDGKYKKGDLKKPHYHVMFIFDGLKSQEQCREIIEEIGGVGLEKIHSVPGYARYLCHLDNPAKAQYDPALVSAFAGADYSQYMTVVKNDRNSAIRGLIKYCDETGVESYAELLKYCAENNEEWFDCLCSTNGTIVIREYLKSVTWTRRKGLAGSDKIRADMIAETQYRKELEEKGLERLPNDGPNPFEQLKMNDNT